MLHRLSAAAPAQDLLGFLDLLGFRLHERRRGAASVYAAAAAPSRRQFGSTASNPQQRRLPIGGCLPTPQRDILAAEASFSTTTLLVASPCSSPPPLSAQYSIDHQFLAPWFGFSRLL